jgi:hypothetical protein
MTWAIVTGMAIGAVVGGGAAALQKKDILQGALMGGVTGAVTGGIGSLGTSAATTAATTAGESALASGATDAIGSSVLNSTASPISSGIEGLGAVGQNAGISTFNPSGMSGLSIPQNFGSSIAAGNPSLSVPTSMANAPALAPPSSNPFFADPMKYLGDNKMSIGLAGLAGGMAPAANQSNAGQEDTTYHPYTYSANLNPGYTGAGTSYFDQGYKKLPTYTAANGGIMSLAEGGGAAPTDSTVPAKPVKKEPTLADYLAATRTASANARNIEMPTMQAQYIAPQQQYTRPIQQVPQAVTDYNNTLMQRAQNEYVDSPQLGAFTSHFNDPVPLPPNADTTNMLYQKYLGRDADPAGYAANKNATAEQITYGLQSSPEYMKANPNAPAPVAPVAGPVNYTYNPATRGYMTSYAPVDPKAPVDPRAGIAALQPQPVAYNYDQGGGGGDGGAFAMGGGIGADYDDKSRFNHGPEYPMQQPQNFNTGGSIYNLGGYSDGGRLLKGPGDGVSDDIPAQIGAKQPARLADGEFVVPARIVSELGNGSTDAGAKRLYAMMDRVQANRRKTVGKGKVAVNSKSSKYLPA